jgi:hypothetical protein
MVNLVAPEKQVAYPEKRWPDSLPDSGQRPMKQLLARLDPQAGLIYPEADLLAGKAQTPMYFRHNSHRTPPGWVGWLKPAGQVVFDNRLRELTGKHVGGRYAIANPRAPDLRRVLVRGDSYSFALGLAYALSAVFAEVACLVEGGDLEAGGEHRAEIVIWQSAERFRATLPAA